MVSRLTCLYCFLREGAIDRLVGIYKDVVHKTGVSLTAYLSCLVSGVFFCFTLVF